MRDLVREGYECIGVDVSQKAVEIATNRRDTAALHYLHFDIETDDTTTLPLQLYLRITCKLVFGFIKDKRAFIRTVRTHLRAGARRLSPPSITPKQ